MAENFAGLRLGRGKPGRASQPMRRFFNEQFEQTPPEWTRELRCRLALKLVSRGWTNKAIAMELGFYDGPHFCREFKRVHGFSPQNYAPTYSRPSLGQTASLA